MSLNKLNEKLNLDLKELYDTGRAKGEEMVITEIIKANGDKGPRYKIEGSDKEFIKMNANSYLGMSMLPEIIEAEEKAAQKYGVGPGAVRFISGTHKPHIDLEKKLADFHGKEACMILSSAYVTSMGVIYPLITKETVLISDELNHNCIIQGSRLTRPAAKYIYKHNDMADLENQIKDAIGKGKRCLVITDGVFSMRGDYAPFKELVKVCKKYEDEFEEGIITIADDSHGVGAFGETGRGTEEVTGSKVDVLIGTLGKAYGVNGGYVCASETVIEYLREHTPMYIYSNPITTAEAATALEVVNYLDSEKGLKRIKKLSRLTKKFEDGLKENGFETIEGPHPVVPLMVRDTKKTSDLVEYLTEKGILATGLNFPVVPKGDEEIRFQVNADHTDADIDYVLNVLKEYDK